MSDTDTPEHYNKTHTVSPGEQLQHQREQLNISVEEAAEALHLRPAVINGLEHDNYDEIPVPTYRRGYLRAYARYLDIDENLVLDAYKTRNGSQETAERKVTPVSIKKPPSRIGAVLFKLVTLAVILGLIAVTVMWWQSRGGSTPPGLEDTSQLTTEDSNLSANSSDARDADNLSATATTADENQRTDSANTADTPPEAPVDDSIPLDQADESAEDTDSAQVSTDTALQNAGQQPGNEASGSRQADDESLDQEQPNNEQAGEEASGDIEALASSQETSDTDAADDSVADNAGNRLELTFNQQSWTEIFDANNQRVFVGLQEPGTTATVEGEPPYRLTIGNSTGVELRYQGEAVDLGERAGANNVARFTLGE
mgnify:CR=1 FL=1